MSVVHGTSYDLETVNKLYLELSHFATATTGKELAMHRAIGDVRAKAMRLGFEIEKMPDGKQKTKMLLLAAEIQVDLNELLP